MNFINKFFRKINLEQKVNCSPTVNVSDEFMIESKKQLILRVSGKYKIGSAGKIDASYICTFANNCIQKYCPDSIIIDLSTLSYEWGDDMDYVLDIGKRFNKESIKTAFIIGVYCKKAIGTLIHGIDSSEPATTENNIFESFESAVKWLSEQ